jgi:hypothetical protein
MACWVDDFAMADDPDLGTKTEIEMTLPVGTAVRWDLNMGLSWMLILPGQRHEHKASVVACVCPTSIMDQYLRHDDVTSRLGGWCIDFSTLAGR